MKRKIEQSLVKAVKSFNLWKTHSSPASDQMRHTAEGAIHMATLALGKKRACEVIREAGLHVPMQVQLGHTGYWNA